MTKAVVIRETGAPEVMRWEDIAVGDPGPGQVRIRQTACGVNFLDTYHRAGTHFMPLALPTILGVEAAGIIEAIGANVAGLAAGQRVAYPLTPGAYAEARLISADDVVPLPHAVSDQVAAATFMKGLTAWHLLCDITKVKAGDTVLVHAAAGGVGLILVQWARHLGATVIGTVSTEAKAAVVREFGCHHPIIYSSEDFVARTKDITNGRGVTYVYDAVGATTFKGSLASVARYGCVVSYGLASGPLPPVTFGEIPQAAFITRGTVRTVTTERARLLTASAAYFDALARIIIWPRIDRTYALRDAVAAHRDLEGRKILGAAVLIV
ncbi:MAG: quinone oxidoreductase [Alphaproteobacteria bacterium]|nr:quinone oxidoreductase [Alphaproteobacteria bacterium]